MRRRRQLGELTIHDLGADAVLRVEGGEAADEILELTHIARP